MKKTILSLICIAFSISYANFTAIIQMGENFSYSVGDNEGDGEGGSGGTTITCDPSSAIHISTLKTMIRNGDDVTNVCTTGLETFESLFDASKYSNSSIVKNFNQDISKWDTSSVKIFKNMFLNSTGFNQNINQWNMSKARDVSGMFMGATKFNKNIADWDLSSVEWFNGMFINNPIFNQDISDWDVSKGKNFDQMFFNATGFNQDIHLWNIKSALIGPSHYFKYNSSLIDDYTPYRYGGSWLDSDSDGVPDHTEVLAATDPFDENSK